MAMTRGRAQGLPEATLLGLVQPWGEVYLRWIPVVGGKPIRPRTAIIPASLVAVLMTAAGLEHYRAAILGYFPEGSMSENWGTVAPATGGRCEASRWTRLPTPIANHTSTYPAVPLSVALATAWAAGHRRWSLLVTAGLPAAFR